jgi:hypothetical protein
MCRSLRGYRERSEGRMSSILTTVLIRLFTQAACDFAQNGHSGHWE